MSMQSLRTKCLEPLNQLGYVCRLMVCSGDFTLQRAHSIQCLEEQADKLIRYLPFPVPHLVKQMLKMVCDLLQPVVTHGRRGAFEGMGCPEELLYSVFRLPYLLQPENFIFDQLQLLLQFFKKNSRYSDKSTIIHLLSV